MNAHRHPSKSGAVVGQGGEIILYRGKNGRTSLDVRLERETIWLSRKQMAKLFDKDTDTIGLHIRNAYKENELDEPSTTEEYSVVQREGNRRVTRNIRFYNLDVIISVGYRSDGGKRLADNALVALTLLIAESKPAEKDIICKVIVNLINRENL